MNETPVPTLRKADFWTSLVLLAIALAMAFEALSYPLEGTYAGVQNAWYVSPALLPLIVAGMLVLLSAFLLMHAVRAGGARAALFDLARFDTIKFWRSSADFWTIGGILAGYIYGLLPRADFIVATILLVFTLVAVYDLRSPPAAARALAIFFAAVLVVVLAAAFGFDPAPRSALAYAQDAGLWLVLVLDTIIVARAAWVEPSVRRRLKRAVLVSGLTPLLLGPAFKYGLLVPLPNEGLTVALMDRVRYGLF